MDHPSECPVCGCAMETPHAHLSKGEHVLTAADIMAGTAALAALNAALRHGTRA